MVAVRDVVLFLVRSFGRSLGRTELMKLVYLADCEHQRVTGSSLTGLRYTRDKLGPVNYAIVEAANELSVEGLIGHQSYETMRNRTRIAHRIRPAGVHAPVDLSADEEITLLAVIEAMRNHGPDEIIKSAYATSPMQHILAQEAELGEELRGVRVPMEDIRRQRTRFSMAELKETLRKADLTIREMTDEALQEYEDLDRELKPYRESAARVVEGPAS